ncbi:hypothetical protein NQ317_001876 [Molorchus minor]|uniref:C2H2-type domain-containing protein n=1 Tax=Molorchus minor TaxID=1323400 RepID=A0ABQ9J558_9CUCU|nr:hypothetical protein NQ317_001876 [Molorchus minor]
MDYVVCASCAGTLTWFLNFAKRCEGTEEKINLYREIQQDEYIIKLSNVLTFLCEDIQCNNVNTKKEGALDNLEHGFKGPVVKEVEIYTCEMCEYQTKHKSNLTRHLLVHRKNSEVKMFECDTCQYKTKHKSCLNRHLLVHGENSDVKMYRCETCHYKARHKSSLDRHIFGP